MAQDKLRQIAILVSSVDAAAARQLLLRLPTETARRVREMATQLGSIPAGERQRVLAEFQRTAVAQSEARPAAGAGHPATSVPAADPSATATHRYAAPAHAWPAAGDGSSSASSRPAQSQPTQADTQPGQSSSTDSRPDPHPAWTRLHPAALATFVRQERPAVAAVVISQLPPEAGVEVLQHLPPLVSHDVLQRLANLQEIDSESMAAIDDHLAQRLGEYQHRVESELENNRRVQALLAAAPEPLRHQWRQLLGSDAQPSESGSPAGWQAASTNRYGESSAASAASAGSDGMHSQVRSAEFSSASSGLAEGRRGASSAGDDGPSEDLGDILPFAAAQKATHAHSNPTAAQPSRRGLSEFDRSLLQLEFEQILQLSPERLASLLSGLDSRCVLLALVGATPEFMSRFNRLLERHDAQALHERLQRLGPLHLRDIDDAQRQVVERAALLRGRGPVSKNSAAAA